MIIQAVAEGDLKFLVCKILILPKSHQIFTNLNHIGPNLAQICPNFA